MEQCLVHAADERRRQATTVAALRDAAQMQDAAARVGDDGGRDVHPGAVRNGGLLGHGRELTEGAAPARAAAPPARGVALCAERAWHATALAPTGRAAAERGQGRVDGGLLRVAIARSSGAGVGGSIVASPPRA
jgi:hypothetical protein